MPIVKGKHFPYTKKGVAIAKKVAKKAGVRIKVSSKMKAKMGFKK